MNSYNGFSPEQRYKALKYHKDQIAKGNKPKVPDICDGCGTQHGFLAWHSEDYSMPFGPHIGEYGLCYRCHMMIHCRYKSRRAYYDYMKMIKNGMRFKPYTHSSWDKFKRENLGPNLLGETEEFLNFDVTKSLILILNDKDVADMPF